MNTKKILSFVACFSVIITQNLFGMKEDSISSKILYGNSPWGNKVAKVEYKKKRISALIDLLTKIDVIKNEWNPELTQKQKARDDYSRQRDELLKSIRLLERKRDALEAEQPHENIDGRIREKREELDDLNRPDGDLTKLNVEIEVILTDLQKNPEYANLGAYRAKCLKSILSALTEEEANNDGWGMLIARALAGPNYNNAFDDTSVSDWKDGIYKGGTVLVVGALSKSLSDKTTNVVDKSVGSLSDFLLAKLIDFGSMVRNVLFHDSNEPFDYQKLDGWQKIIMAAYDDIDNMLRNGLRDSTRSLDSVSRQFDDTGTEVQVKKEIDMWSSLASGYAEQFAYFVTLFEKRREYYDEDDIVAFYSNQICQMLQTTCKLLTNSKSLKDLDTKLESQRTIIPAIKKNLWNLFEQLKAEVKPKSYSIKDTVTSTASTYKPSAYNAYSGSNAYGYNNDGPTSFAGGF